MKILIVAFYYPPEDSWAKMASLRPASWKKYWEALGHEVSVLTDDKGASAKNVYGVNYWPSRPRWGEISASKAGQDSQKLRAYTRLRSLFNSFQTALKFGSLFQTSNFWIYGAVQKGMSLFDEVGFDVIVSTYGPPANHIVASLLKKKTNCFWVADYRDLWYGNDFVVSQGIFAFVEEKVENACVSKADLITAVSIELSKNLNARFSSDVVTIENGFDPDDLENIETYTWSDKKIRLMYPGQIYAGKRDPGPLLDALLLLQNRYPNLAQRLEVLFYGWNLDELARQVDDLTLHDVVSVNAPKPRKEILGLQRSVDALIFLDWNDPKVNGVLTGKLFEYFFSGKPIIGISSTADSAAGKLMLDLGVGYPTGNSIDKIVDVIDSLLNGQTLGYSPDSQKIQQFTRQKLANKMLDGIMDCMGDQKSSIRGVHDN
ncbi:MAG: hypothetical protein ACFB14_27600 [Leptolyngbyaceae cyanobacterium]